MISGKPFYVSVFIVVAIQVATIAFIYLDNRNSVRGEYCNLEQVLAVDAVSHTAGYIQRVVIVKNGSYKSSVRKTVIPEVNNENPCAIDPDTRKIIEQGFGT